MFEEPGVVGSIAILLLFIDRFNLRSKQNIILFVAGLLSFSFFFYVSIIIFLVYFANNKNRLLFVLIFILFYFLSIKNEYINTLIWDRFAFENGWIKGDNRSTIMLDNKYQEFLNSDNLLWGRGGNYTYEYGEGSSSYKMLIMQDGLSLIHISEPTRPY